MNEQRDSSNRLTYDFSKIEIKSYLKITKSIISHFELEEASELVHGFDETFQDFKSGRFLIGLEWDIWSGYIIVAKNLESETLVKEIATYVNESFCKNT
ncbi:MAG: hypothetical protein ABW168_03015 [Sedimenticola sp.]